MQPSDRIEARILESDIPETLKFDILNSIKWYRMALYKSAQENKQLQDRVDHYSWIESPGQGMC